MAVMSSTTSFSSPTLKRMMASVHANISGVAKNSFACCSAEPMELRGWAMTSAAMPAFQHMPSERRTAVRSMGNAAGA